MGLSRYYYVSWPPADPPPVKATKEYRKKRLYLEHPPPDVAYIHRRVTRYIPPSPPAVVIEEPLPPPVVLEPLPPPPPVVYEPPPPPPLELPAPPPPPPIIPLPEPDPIEVIAVDVEPSRRKRSPKRRSRSRSHSTREKEVYIERERLIPVPVPVPVEPKYDTYRYVEGPRRYIEAPPPQRKMITEDEREHIVVRDHRRMQEYYRR